MRTRVRSSVREKEATMTHALEEALGVLRGAEVWVGLAGTPGSEEANELVDYASANEFGRAGGRGRPRIPERSFMRSTADAKTSENNKKARALFFGLINSTQALQQLNLIGALNVGWVQMTIRSNVPPPNAPMTTANKKSTTTLIDTGRMFQSIKHQLALGQGKVTL